MSHKPQVAFADVSLAYMILPTKQSALPEPDKNERWDLDRPLDIYKGDTYALASLKVIDRKLVPVKNQAGEEMLDKDGKPLMAPAGEVTGVEFRFDITRKGNEKRKAHFRYGRKENQQTQDDNSQ